MTKTNLLKISTKNRKEIMTGLYDYIAGTKTP